METNILAVRPLISPREAEKMIWVFIRHGNHSHRDAIKDAPKHSIEKWFAANNQSLKTLIPRCRWYFKSGVPFVENYIGSTWTVSSEGSEIKTSIIKGGRVNPEIEIEGPGTIGIDYESKFESACRARDRTIESASLDDLHTAIIKGIASIESYIAHIVTDWNHSAIDSARLDDSKSARTSFEDKIKIWVPTMADGRKLNLGGQMWADFLLMQGIRDNDAIHAKKLGCGISFKDLALVLNKFKTGIADFLLQLHILFGDPAPRVVIRARFYPEIYVQQKTIKT